MRISHNLMAFNAQYNLKTVTGKKAKETEKLASGYRINRAADDAAGLAISEKMRKLIRGLNQGSENASDGISWSQSGDGALNEAHDIVHRMTELTIQSLNGTLSKEDRYALEAEFEHLQSELDKIGTTTTFNNINIFEQHKVPYYQCEGGVKWDPHQMHVVTAGKNELIFTYREAEGDAAKTMTLTVPPGEYTTQELIDEIDDLTTALNRNSLPALIVEFDKDGYCNANLEGGEKIDSITGDMSYLFYDMFRGGGYGALIGTTIFSNDVIKMPIVTGQNDYMKFNIENLDGTSMVKEIKIPQGAYSRPELINYLNSQLADTTVKATAYGDGIRLASDEAIVTGFKGNMFKIDSTKPIYDSVFYDNVKYGQVTQTSAEFIGGCVLPNSSKDAEHMYYRIVAGVNDELIIQPKGCPDPVTLTIPEGEYTATTMVEKLKQLLQDKGITNLEVSRISKGNFEGIKITATDKGVDSKINMDATSSAYNTLFVTKTYNSYEQTIYPVNETREDKDAVFKGSKNLDAEIPITITAGDNDQFAITINGGTKYTITLSAGTYATAEAIRQEIDNQLNGAGALAGYKGKLAVTLQDGKMVLTGAVGEKVDEIELDKTGKCFEDIFQGYQIIKHTQIATGNPATLNTPYNPATDTIPNGSQMKITIDGVDHMVNIPSGNPTQAEVEKAIEDAIQGSTTEVLNKFSYAEATGNSQPRDFGTPAEGTTTVTNWSKYVTGSSDKVEGEVGAYNSKPAVLTIGVKLQDQMVVDDTNNQITLVMNDEHAHKKTVTLTLEPNKTYTKESLVAELQTKIDAAFGTSFGGAIVSLSDDKNNLVLTSRLGEYDDGAMSYIECSTTNSSFLKELNTKRTAAEWKSSRSLNSNITITAANNEFKFNFTENGTTREIVIFLAEKTYTAAELVTEIDTQLNGSGVRASLSGGALCLTSDEKGSGLVIDYKTATGGSSAEAMFGPLLVETPATIVTSRDTQTTISITDGSDGNPATNGFNITVNGTTYNLQLKKGDYNRESFKDMLNECFANNNVPAEVYLSGGKLAYRTTGVGNSVSISMNYDTGGSSMEQIYGKTTINYPAIEATFGSDGKLSLSTPTKPSATIEVDSNFGGPFQTHTEETKLVSTTSETGYHSTKHAYIDGVSLNGDITIDQWNNDLKFDFKDGDVGNIITIKIEVPQKTYTYAELETELQNLIDNSILGPGKITVTVNGDGVRMEAVKPGYNNTFPTYYFSGDFYYKVIGKAVEQSNNEIPVANEGKQYVDSAYTVGRKDVKNVTTRIQSGISDELKMELTYGNDVYELVMKLDEGYYSSDALKQHLQQKINEQLVANGLPQNLILVGIGGINTGVHGSNDQNALNFSLSKTIQAPSEGQFIIDGVSGNAAFEIFYQTDGSLEQAYVTGTKDVSDGVTIEAGKEDISFEVDGNAYSITIPEGTYTAAEIKTALNDALEAISAPVKAEINEDGKIKIKHKKMGEHDIKNIAGSAMTSIFYSEKGEKEPKAGRYVKLNSSAEESSNVMLDNPIFNTCFMKINSICISQEKYARKALDRINDALQYISKIRSDFGSTQNRLEHALRNNENAAENLQAAESKIRDEDMAKGMVALSAHNIIEQAGQAMLAQANQLQQGVLSLLR